MQTERLSTFSPLLHGFTVEKMLVYKCFCDQQAVNTPQITLIRSTSAILAMAGRVFIGLLSHKTRLETMPFIQPSMTSRLFGDDILSQSSC